MTVGNDNLFLFRIAVLKKVLLFLLIVVASLIGTLCFMLYHHQLYSVYALEDWCQVLIHSVPQHLTVAGYVMALPFLLEIVRIWSTNRGAYRLNPLDCIDWHSSFMSWYMAVMSVPLTVGWAVNIVLYGYWGIVLDGTALIYVLDNPAAALAESPWWAVLIMTGLSLLVAWSMFLMARRLFSDSRPTERKKVCRTFAVLLLCALDFLAIRGGWTASTMNPGRAYFCSEMPLNHAAVDPVFNFLYAVSKNQRFDQQYRFMSRDEALAAIAELNAPLATTSLLEDSCTPTEPRKEMLLQAQRPNILLILLESFSGTACHYLNPDSDPGWMPNVNAAMAEGVAFMQMYANSFRTDRGVAATLASYPGQPTYSVMKDQSKCNNLQYLSKRLGEVGYRLQFIHGGDVNFTNMQGFLRAGGISDIVRDTDFPIGERLDKWGVRDDRMAAYVAERVVADAESDTVPFFKVWLTLSSHEPFEVPYHHYSDPYLNSIAYADSCLGAMIAELKANPLVWDNLLVIGLPDHCYARFPADIMQHEPRRYHIPMFWTGGAVSSHCEVSVIGQQTDLSATLLGQLGIHHDDFCFSKDLLDSAIGHYAFYAFSDGLGLITDSCQYIQDNKNSGIGLQPGTFDPEGKAERWGKAYLQLLYDDLQNR